jgi:hypothetical protein
MRPFHIPYSRPILLASATMNNPNFHDYCYTESGY